MTLVDSSIAEVHRRAKQWSVVYSMIPQFRVYPQVHALIATLRAAGIPVCVVTSSPRSYTEKVVDAHGLHLPSFVCYHDTAKHKPHPAPYLRAMSVMGVKNPAKVIACGDAPADIEAGHTAGMVTAACLWGASDVEALRKANPTILCTSATDLREFILRQEAGPFNGV